MAIGLPLRKYLDEDGQIPNFSYSDEDEIENKVQIPFLDMKSDLHPPNYEWYRSVLGKWHHWEKKVFNGQIILHVEGSEEVGGYWGSIRSIVDLYGQSEAIFSTYPVKGIHVPFKTPENCALHIDEKWKKIINDEHNR